MLEFDIEGKTLFKQLARLQSLAGASLLTIYLKASKKQYIELQASINNRRVLIRQPTTVNTPGSLLVNKQFLADICKNRGSILFKQNNTLMFKSHHFFGSIPIITMPEKLDLLEFTQAQNPLPKDLQKELQQVIKKSQLKSVYETDKLSLFMQLKEKKFYVGVADKYHASLAVIDAKSYYKDIKEFEKAYVIPLEYSSILASSFTESTVQFFNKDNHVMFTDGSTVLELPALQTQDIMLDSLLAINHVADSTVTINMENFNTILDSCNTPNADLFIHFKKGSKALDIKFKSEHSEISDSLAVGKKIKQDIVLKADIKNLKDVAEKLSGEVRLSFNQYVIVFVQNNMTYYSQLLQKE